MAEQVVWVRVPEQRDIAAVQEQPAAAVHFVMSVMKSQGLGKPEQPRAVHVTVDSLMFDAQDEVTMLSPHSFLLARQS